MSAPSHRFAASSPASPAFDDDSWSSSYLHTSAIARRTRIEWDRAVVLAAAHDIEADPKRAEAWFNDEPIHELGDKTARQLVDEGATARLLNLLTAIHDGQRGR